MYSRTLLFSHTHTKHHRKNNRTFHTSLSHYAATESSTKSYSNRYPNALFSTNERTKWTTSRVGCGTFDMIMNDDYRMTLGKALREGCNVVSNSTFSSEGDTLSLTRAALRDVSDVIQRDEVVIACTIGLMKGERLKAYRMENPYDDVVKISYDVWQCMSPKFIEDEITYAIDKLATDKIDIVMLSIDKGLFYHYTDHKIPVDVIYERLEGAFQQLEKEVEKGRIQYYGISSYNMINGVEDEDFVSLEKIYEIASKVKSDHHFIASQFPCNMIETGAYHNKSNNGLSPIEFSKKHDLMTFSYRPLNALIDKLLIFRFVEIPERVEKDIPNMVSETLNRAIFLEKNYPPLLSAEYEGQDLPEIYDLQWGHVIGVRSLTTTLIPFTTILERDIQPVLRSAFAKLERSEDQFIQEWVQTYKIVIQELFRWYMYMLQYNRNHELNEFNQSLPPSLKREELTHSQRAVHTLFDFGIDTTLVGMRKDAYVTDILSSLETYTPTEIPPNYLESISKFLTEIEKEVICHIRAEEEEEQQQQKSLLSTSEPNTKLD
eukprot:TRINITY_DN3286_c0_g1_i1.p1 TRINITY_DN3286_c0_g1~~TRINITY_DN3286_c0_g1_i1.p1  ORF type:complete len:547 (-),score=119.28 TRINITY_DN3286_c0_g1_i1:40-1680(-)